MGGRGSPGSGLLVLCGLVGGVHVCVCDVAEGAERQNSGRPDSKRVTTERERERGREKGRPFREEEVNVTQISLSYVRPNAQENI